ncbi:MAG: mechanosensitive ion channel family protein [Methanomassiliicoccaceae archaeon]|nr:mechanosensitive ion channel family protein [Methanomassiliicoccaceae archaeon]
MHVKRAALILALVMAVTIAAPLLSDEAKGDKVLGVEFSFSPSSYDEISLKAGESRDIYIHLYNNSGSTRCVEFIGATFSHGSVHASMSDTRPVEIADGTHTMLTLTVTADRYTGSTSNIDATFLFIVYDPNVEYDPAAGGEHPMYKTVHISSRLASENQYNRIMGIWDNPLPEPFDTAPYAAAVTLMIWLVIAAFASLVIIPKILMPVLFRKKGKEDRKAVFRKIQRPLFMILLLYGITVCLPVLGVGEYIIDMVTTVAYVIYIVLGAWIFLKIYAALLDMWEKHAHEDDDEYDVRNSMTPLLMVIGKIVVAMAAVAAIMGVLGFDLMLIITGAGIIGLAISFGAQSTLAQFFGGITLLVNRPFRPGDLIRLDDSNDTLRVMNVGFMITTFRNWGNSEIFSMPNQKVVSSTIINVTAESLAYRIIVLVRVPYGTDIALAKKLALAAMTEHPRILQDGSEEIPKVRVEELSESSLTIRVSGFVDDFEDHRSIAADIRESIYAKYRENGVVIAVPKLDIYIKDPNDGERMY